MKKTWTTPGGSYYELYKDMLAQPHLLIAGTTGSGKSVVINALIYTALRKAPTEAAFILCDPKMVELSKYASLPHVVKYADTLTDIAAALQYGHDLMMARFAAMKAQGLAETTEKDVYIIVDEYADLVTKGADRAENALKRACEGNIESIGKLGRAAHVHLILATQAPNRQTIKANIVLNMSARLALRCTDPLESRQIIGCPGAESLPYPRRVGRAEGLYKTDEGITHYNIPMIDPAEIDRQTSHWMAQAVKPSIWSRLFKKTA